MPANSRWDLILR